MIIQEETQQQIGPSITENFSVAAAVQSRGHTEDRCRLKKANQNARSIQSSNNRTGGRSANAVETTIGGDNSTESSGFPVNFTNEQLQKLAQALTMINQNKNSGNGDIFANAADPATLPKINSDPSSTNLDDTFHNNIDSSIHSPSPNPSAPIEAQPLIDQPNISPPDPPRRSTRDKHPPAWHDSYILSTQTNDPTGKRVSQTDGYFNEFGSNFFYKDCPGVVNFIDLDNSNKMFTLPGVLSVECANFVDSRERDIKSFDKNGLRILPSDLWAIRREVKGWVDYPSAYSCGVFCSNLQLNAIKVSDLRRWVIANSPRYGVIDVYMRDHYGEMNAKCFAIHIFGQCVLEAVNGVLFPWEFDLKERSTELDANDSGLRDVKFGEPLEGSIESKVGNEVDESTDVEEVDI
ncbi:hypothetical protein GH714_000651 [Hevea brasiliensis]|uniref:Uncharacterized protein n=1 Tax=Hevea brasiliensis TaxID=3981 RepID=A0A6A6KF08_HEVBR|nr:hypothetical protein GH714_000651 [Hevea brasiliensis]